MFTFIIVGIVGMALLLISLAVGSLFDIGDGDLSTTSLGAGGVVFGAIGSVITANNWPIAWAYVASALFAVLTVIGVQRLIRRLRESEDGQPRKLVGVTGTVVTTVSPTRPGEVSLDDPGELERRLAWADTEIAEGTRVVVVQKAGSRVKVRPVEVATPQDAAQAE